MTTDNSVKTTTYQADKRGWLRGSHGTGPGDNPRHPARPDDLQFQRAHYPNGYIPSGIVLGQIASMKRYGPFDSTASDGRQTAVGHLFAAITMPWSRRPHPLRLLTARHTRRSA